MSICLVDIYYMIAYILKVVYDTHTCQDVIFTNNDSHQLNVLNRGAVLCILGIGINYFLLTFRAFISLFVITAILFMKWLTMQ